MANQQYADQKCPLQFTKGEIDRAGDSIRHKVQGEARAEAIRKIQAFREFHLYPLMLLKNHLARTSKKVGRNIIVARRLKRLPTILDKLERPTLNGQQNNTIRVTTMQDVAGCRAIVKNKKQLIDLLKRLQQSRSVHQIINTRDYLTKPKDDGYGGIHLIYSCYSGQEAAHNWKGAKVEVQLRTELQHAWATSLEIIDTLKGMNLKTGREGHEDWREFFASAGRIVAHQEGLCLLEPKQLLQIRTELSVLEKKLNVMHEISRFAFGITYANHVRLTRRNGDGLYLITSPVQDLKKEGGFLNIKVYSYKRSESDVALRDLNRAELDDTIFQSVLVSVQNARTLRQAYPNFFGSTRDFTRFIRSNLVQI
ncbi:RelA/SpoT domain-containing protein (plasmid) [Shewanella xiamenensis]|uniref:RelA/SpoT domain-containing protein n=1 Tax=Shewanella xiamenensis TaxID=332186 RepID=A0ABT6UDT9_9GAMM|nr:RelA/SpoT domain-containing protein [Shewanella xiamenensis]MDI5832641.1 RelA/SpoT domain-containing protein [Shewanella xiamenensis]WHF58001.1 RelA/SpoT domain-containing protein [Shewanella xiamenensis]